MCLFTEPDGARVSLLHQCAASVPPSQYRHGVRWLQHFTAIDLIKAILLSCVSGEEPFNRVCQCQHHSGGRPTAERGPVRLGPARRHELSRAR